MKNLLRITLFGLLCLAIVGNSACTSTHTIAANPGAVEQHNIKAGDEVQLRFADHTMQAITVTEVDENGISGVDSNGKAITAAYKDLDSVVFTSVDGGKTARNAGKAVGFVALVAVVVAAVGVATLSQGMEGT